MEREKNKLKKQRYSEENYKPEEDKAQKETKSVWNVWVESTLQKFNRRE